MPGTPLQRVLAAWVQDSFTDAFAARAQERRVASTELRHNQKCLESAGRCLTEAVKQLAPARRVAAGRGKAVRLAALKPSEMPVRRGGVTGK